MNHTNDLGKPMHGLRVLDLGLGPVTGMATMVMSDFGADVINVEPPGGDRFRELPHSPTWLRGKRTVEQDLHTPEGHEFVRSLAARADVLVTHLHPSRASELGLGYEQVSATNPGLVYCNISGFGADGPYADYPGYEGLVAAKSGRMLSFQGIPDREGPAFAPLEVACHLASQGAIAAVLSALVAREDGAGGQYVETSLLRAMMAFDLAGLVREQIGGPLPDVTAAPLSYHPLPTADGRWLQMGNLLQHLFDNFVVAAGLGELYADPRFQGPWGQWDTDAREEFREHMLGHMCTKTAQEWMEIFAENGGIAATEFHTTAEGMNDPDVIANGHSASIEHPDLGKVRTLGLLARLTETPGSVDGSSAEVHVTPKTVAQSWATSDPAPLSSAQIQGHEVTGPLAGTTILEFATIIAAPLGASMLADLGARVIKVEPIGGDPFRGMGDGTGVFALKTTAGKESICLDLKRAEAQEIISRLVGQADALIHNYRPGVPERLGIGYEQCIAQRPDILHVSVNGYGPEGPSAHRPATHPIPGAALGGAVRQSAGAHRWQGSSIEELRRIANRLYRSNEISPDPSTSAVVTSATVMGLLARKRLGVGQQIFVDMLGANSYANAFEFIDYASKPPATLPDEMLYGVGPTYRLYQAREGWAFLALTSDSEFAHFCELAGVPQLATDPEFRTKEMRTENADALVAQLTALFACKTADEWEQILAPSGVGCVRADELAPGAFWYRNEHVRSSGLVQQVPHSRWGSYWRWGANSACHGTPASLSGSPLAGEQSHPILRMLGFSQDEYETLARDGVVWSEPVVLAEAAAP